jgi:hypothetical protein
MPTGLGINLFEYIFLKFESDSSLGPSDLFGVRKTIKKMLELLIQAQSCIQPGR